MIEKDRFHRLLAKKQYHNTESAAILSISLPFDTVCHNITRLEHVWVGGIPDVVSDEPKTRTTVSIASSGKVVIHHEKN